MPLYATVTYDVIYLIMKFRDTVASSVHTVVRIDRLDRYQKGQDFASVAGVHIIHVHAAPAFHTVATRLSGVPADLT